MTTKEERRNILSDAAVAIGHCAEDVGTGLDDLTKTVTTENPWGADGPGSVFGLAYTEVVNHAIETLSSHTGQLFDTASNLVTWVDLSGQTEEENDIQISWVGQQVEEA
jgi:hypothetical protein